MARTTKALALFAGAGGMEVHDKELGIKSWGIENDKAACATREAAGLQTQCADVSKVTLLPNHGFHMLTGGPPCQTFSTTGNGSGRRQLDAVLAELANLVARFYGSQVVNGVWGFRQQTDWIKYDRFEDVRTGLVLEPLRYILAAVLLEQPFESVALEQVPAVLPVWEAYADVLRVFGYHVVTGIVRSDEHGVAQTRKRAVLLASRTKAVELPEPTHERYGRTGNKAGLLPWVSMRAALGDLEPGAVLRSNYGTGGDASKRGTRTADQPAPTVTGKVDRNKWLYRNGNQTNAAKRPLDAPAPTVHFAARSNKVEWMEPELAPDPAASGVRVSVEEAAVFQSFPRDWPWRGTKTQQYQQVGNAIPPLLAKALLKELL